MIQASISRLNVGGNGKGAKMRSKSKLRNGMRGLVVLDSMLRCQIKTEDWSNDREYHHTLQLPKSC